jgi:hypothetical protein
MWTAVSKVTDSEWGEWNFIHGMGSDYSILPPCSDESSYPVNTWGPFSGGYATGAWCWKITRFSADVKNTNKVISVPPYMNTAWNWSTRITLPLLWHKISFTDRLAEIMKIYTIIMDNFCCKGFQPVMNFIYHTLHYHNSIHMQCSWPRIAFFLH